MATPRFATRLYRFQADIHARFRAHQSTIRALAAEYRVGQETMRQFLMHTMEDYQEVVRDLRRKISLCRDLWTSGIQLPHAMWAQCDRSGVSGSVRTLRDFSPEELKEIQRRLESRMMETRIDYHEYIVSPLRGDS